MSFQISSNVFPDFVTFVQNWTAKRDKEFFRTERKEKDKRKIAHIEQVIRIRCVFMN